MKIKMRKPSISKSLRAKTTGRITRTAKSSLNPMYGKKGMGYINNPKRAVKNAIYSRTTASAFHNSAGSPAHDTEIVQDTVNTSRLSCGGIFFLVVIGLNVLLWGGMWIHNTLSRNMHKPAPVTSSSTSSPTKTDVVFLTPRPFDKVGVIGEWDDGKIWSELQFYDSYDNIYADGLMLDANDKDDEKTGTYRFNGDKYFVAFTKVDFANFQSISVRSQNSDLDDITEQYNSVVASIVEKWGKPTSEFSPIGKTRDEYKTIEEAIASAQEFVFGSRWYNDRYTASADLHHDDTGAYYISFGFVDSGEQEDGK